MIDENELLVFSEIDKNLKNAYQEQKQKNLESIFETTNSPHTVTLSEAIDRLKKVCGYKISKKFREKIEKLDRYRNQITHSAISLEENEINNVFMGLVDEIDTFFMNVLGEKYKTLTGYSDFKDNYIKYLEKLDETKRSLKKEAIEMLIEAFSKCSISMGENEVKIIDDINIVSQLIKILTNSNLSFGTDLYNGYCSGDVSIIKRIKGNRISLFTTDNYTEYRFKFKSLLLYLPKVESELSPILFFEAADDKVSKELEQFVEKDHYERSTLQGLFFREDKRYEWGFENISNFFYSQRNEEETISPDSYWKIEDFLDEGIFCFLNIQGLNYGNMGSLLNTKYTLKELEVALRKGISEKV